MRLAGLLPLWKVITHVVNKKTLKLETIAVVVVSLSATLFAQTPEALSASAQQAAQAHRYEEAERLWRNAIDSSPRYFPALFNLGLFFFSRQQFNDAVPFLERAAEVSPQDFNSHYLRGACYQSLERGDDALRAWRTALKLNPNNARLLQIMVVEYGKGRYFQEAAEVARRASSWPLMTRTHTTSRSNRFRTLANTRKRLRLPVEPQTAFRNRRGHTSSTDSICRRWEKRRRRSKSWRKPWPWTRLMKSHPSSMAI